ncbi:hypothetical protein ACFVU2_21265 [Leifsonia sp. NPDC058194]|uniref:hypothetical protein n=1 Tax=Leifsonia sp. NPDC058194 TaxID=3346374 RepID=UPI0036DF6A2F
MTRTDLINMIARRQTTVAYADRTVEFLQAYSGALDDRYGVPVDGDALAILRRAVS